ncbi:hypothetical protein [Psychroserpens sp. NJDZ02]|uniref:hypothetical protein n=1 Tax=Psychroserpens sp. NJDZ02 TaxID=2570561 RepID=UPI0010A92BE6|nr:hypothetical protein [Psychroserpens sp. NJDZ02]
MMLTSCNSQNEDSIDLSKEILGKHIDSIVSPNIKINRNSMNHYGLDNGSLKTSSKELMNFNGVNLYGFFNEGDNYLKNSVKFGFVKKDSIIAIYELFTYQTEKSNQLIKALDDFLGKPNFTSYQKVEDRKERNYDGKLWEDKTNNYTYLLHVSIQKYGKECWLFVVNNNQAYFYDRAIGLPSFSKWSNYLKFKEYNESPENFTYQDYIKDQTEKGDEYISILTE